MSVGNKRKEVVSTANSSKKRKVRIESKLSDAVDEVTVDEVTVAAGDENVRDDPCEADKEADKVEGKLEKKSTVKMHKDRSGCSSSAKFAILRDKVIEATPGHPPWDQARTEWTVSYIFEQPNGTCICTHHPITDHCVIRHCESGNQLIVGNICVGHFGTEMKKTVNNAMSCYKRMQKHSEAKPNAALLSVAKECGVLSQRDLGFAYDTLNKRDDYLSMEQFKWRNNIREKIRIAFRHPAKNCTCGNAVYAKPSRFKAGTVFFKCTKCNSYVTDEKA